MEKNGNSFCFKTDGKSYAFCMEIARKMSELFGITMEQAVEQINIQWEGQDVLGDSLIYHETEEYWAQELYGAGAADCTESDLERR